MEKMNQNAFVKNFKWPVMAVVALTLLSLNAFGGPAVLDTAINPDNGHVYYLLDKSDWTSAENAAVALGGHLATIRNTAEDNWIWNRWGNGANRNLWIGLH